MERTIKIASLSTAVLLGVSGLAACGSNKDSSSAAQTPSASPSSSASASPSASASSSTNKASSSPAAKSAMITIKDYKYSGTTKVAAGTKITVKNDDSEAHTVTADTGSAFTVTIPPGTSKTFTAPSKAGTYKYHCNFHSDMHGTLTVS